MNDALPPDAPEPSDKPATRRHWFEAPRLGDGTRDWHERPLAWVAWQLILIAIPAAALMFAIGYFAKKIPSNGTWVLDALLAATALAACCWGPLQRERHWAKPSRDLRKLIRAVRDGEEPIESLNTIQGGPSMLATEMAEVFRELRQQRALLAETDEEVRLRVANRTGALERQIGSLVNQANRDALSGLLNRRALESELPKLIERARNPDGDDFTFCMLMIDVDNFKPLNDTLGHAAGDEFLKNIGKLVRSSLRPQDLAFRCGGDEFVVLLMDVDLDSARATADRLSGLVRGLGRPLKLKYCPALSIGLACSTEVRDLSGDALSRLADSRLYEVKKTRPRSRPAA